MKRLRIKVFKKDKIELPYIGKDKFRDLMRIGLGYEHGVFYIRDLNRVEEIKDTLSEILNDEIAFSQTCVTCKKEFLCYECKHYSICLTRDLPLQCICKDCYIKSNLYDLYINQHKHEK